MAPGSHHTLFCTTMPDADCSDPNQTQVVASIINFVCRGCFCLGASRVIRCIAFIPCCRMWSLLHLPCIPYMVYQRHVGTGAAAMQADVHSRVAHVVAHACSDAGDVCSRVAYALLLMQCRRLTFAPGWHIQWWCCACAGDDWGNLIYLSLVMDQGSGDALQVGLLSYTAAAQSPAGHV